MRANGNMKSQKLVKMHQNVLIFKKPCIKCGYDTGKSTTPTEGNKTCWKCGNFVRRDYSNRALKKCN